jgi:hypothetical protein
MIRVWAVKCRVVCLAVSCQEEELVSKPHPIMEELNNKCHSNSLSREINRTVMQTTPSIEIAVIQIVNRETKATPIELSRDRALDLVEMLDDHKLKAKRNSLD